MDSLAREAVVPRLRGRFAQVYTYVTSTPSTQPLLAPEAPQGRWWPPESRPRAAAGSGGAGSPRLLLVESGRKTDRAELLAEVLDRLERRYDRWLSE